MSSKPEEASTARGFLNHISSMIIFRGYIYISKIMDDIKDQYPQTNTTPTSFGGPTRVQSMEVFHPQSTRNLPE